MNIKSIKLAVFDLDGTLLDVNHNLQDCNLKAIEKLRNKGIEITFATGRVEFMSLEYIEKAKINFPIIFCNGSKIKDMKTNEVIYNRTLDDLQVIKFVDYCKDLGVDWFLYTDKGVVTEINERYNNIKERNTKIPKKLRTNLILDNNDYTLYTKCNKLLIIEKNELIRNEIYKFFSNYDNINIISSKETYIDIGPKNIGKELALKELLNRYDLTFNNVVAFGDQNNDVGMLKQCKYGIAMKHASVLAKESADYIAKKSNSQSGVAEGVEWLLDLIAK